MRLIITFLAIALLFCSVASASDYLPLKVNTAFDLTISSDTATACNLSYIQYPDGHATFYNKPLSKNGNSYSLTLSTGNYSSLGPICHGIVCSGTITETGSICRDVTPSGFNNILGFTIIIFTLLYLITFIGAYYENFTVAVLGGMGLIALGLFSINNGIDVYRNAITNTISLTTLGLGAYFAISGGVKLIQETM
jgi:hypothetical protein